MLLATGLACAGLGGAEECFEHDATRCHDDRAERCVRYGGLGKKLTWRTLRPTCYGPATCVETDRGAMCLAEPVRSCDADDDEYCDDNRAYDCVRIGDDDYAWEVEDCTAVGRRCEMVGGKGDIADCVQEP